MRTPITWLKSHRTGWERCSRCQNAVWTAIRTIFRPKTHHVAVFCIYYLNVFPGSYPRTPQKRPRCLDQTTISAWLTSVPIVLILRKDRCVKPIFFIGDTIKHALTITMPDCSSFYSFTSAQNLYVLCYRVF